MKMDSTTQNFLSPVVKLWLRFFSVYFFIYIFPFPVGSLPLTGTVNNWYHKPLDALILWTGRYIFHVPFPVVPANSTGTDTTYDYIQVFVFAIIALAGVIAWYIAGKKNDSRIFFWVSLYVRYRLAFSMIYYGLVKIIKVQFPFPYYSLNESYGESSPMRLMWSFMGYSTTYNQFIGWSELIAGVLIFFRKTTLTGALMSLVILSNVVMMNLCYDASVKVHSINLLLMAVFIALPYAKQVFRFLFSDQMVSSLPPNPFKPRINPRLKSALYVVKFSLILCICYSYVLQVWKLSLSMGDNAVARTPLFGVYDVEKFKSTSPSLPANQADTLQWKSLTIYRPQRATVTMITDSTRTYHFVTDTLVKKVRFYEDTDSVHANILSYTLQDEKHLTMSGRIGADSVYMLLRKHNLEDYRLINRGFHWINESTYNK